LFLSCNGIANSIKHSVEEDVADAKDALRQEESKARAAYTTTYQSSIQHVSDHQLKIKLLLLDSTIAAGVKYMDSISGIMNLMPQDDPRNIEYLKNRFIYGGIGDTLFAVLNRVNDLARDVAQQTGHIAKVDSLRLTILNQPAADAWEQQDFSMLDPITAIVFFNIFVIEIFQCGKECLPGGN